MSAAVELRGLCIDTAYGRLVGPLDLNLPAGECVGLVGESGSGKSLTTLALLDLLPEGLRASGTLVVDGAPVPLHGKAHAQLRGRHIGWVPQDPLAALHPMRQVGDQLRETLRYAAGLDRRAAQQRALELIGLVRLPDAAVMLRRYPHQLSGGQRQRVLVALALACGPRCCWLTSPHQRWTRTSVRRCWSCSGNCAPSWAWVCCWSATTWARWRGTPTG
ncbi:ATP-binding cassette domain-containing protein [Alkalisalibacterium limincola]|uniref:ATP-binding cassette domain-containing protein n=1 Tax=Alkalisalibacterium limincola TaxID=2699169 RepID=UPI0021048B8C|nr:ATP-binding cassette domain-containing protein [Alkalisalibacterium limincola]